MGDELDYAQIFSSRLAGPAICNDVERDFLPFVKGAHASAFDRADMNKNFLVTVFRLNKTETLLVVKPLHCSHAHRGSFPLKLNIIEPRT